MRQLLLIAAIFWGSLPICAGEDPCELYEALHLAKQQKRVFLCSETYLAKRSRSFALSANELREVVLRHTQSLNPSVASILLGTRHRSVPHGGVPEPLTKTPFEVVSYIAVDNRRTILDANGLVVVFGDGEVLSGVWMPMTDADVTRAKAILKSNAADRDRTAGGLAN